jgi:hypothetical protein
VFKIFKERISKQNSTIPIKPKRITRAKTKEKKWAVIHVPAKLDARNLHTELSKTCWMKWCKENLSLCYILANNLPRIVYWSGTRSDVVVPSPGEEPVGTDADGSRLLCGQLALV